MDENTLINDDQIHDTTWIGVVVSVGDISAERFAEILAGNAVGAVNGRFGSVFEVRARRSLTDQERLPSQARESGGGARMQPPRGGVERRQQGASGEA